MHHRHLPPHRRLPSPQQRAEFAFDNFMLLIWAVALIGVALEVLYNDTIYFLGFMITVTVANLILRVVDILYRDSRGGPEIDRRHRQSP